MDDVAIDLYLREQGLTPQQIERARWLIDNTNLDPAEAAFAVCLADGQVDGDVLRNTVEKSERGAVTVPTT